MTPRASCSRWQQWHATDWRRSGQSAYFFSCQGKPRLQCSACFFLGMFSGHQKSCPGQDGLLPHGPSSAIQNIKLGPAEPTRLTQTPSRNFSTSQSIQNNWPAHPVPHPRSNPPSSVFPRQVPATTTTVSNPQGAPQMSGQEWWMCGLGHFRRKCPLMEISRVIWVAGLPAPLPGSEETYSAPVRGWKRFSSWTATKKPCALG